MHILLTSFMLSFFFLQVTREIGLFILQFDKLNIVRQTSSLSLCRKREEHQREEVDSFPPGPLERWLYILQDDL